MLRLRSNSIHVLPQDNKDDGSASRNAVVSCIDIEDNKDKSWLRLGAFSSSVEDHRQPQQPQQPPYCHDQLLTMRGASLVYNHQLTRPQTLINAAFSFPSSTPWIPQYTAPCRPSSLE
ncbi:hypothetical protein Bca52824_064092 [Brassica carinata]|uniref:Uncharacterized protein n=1 Tax=Brassica carinata TaxID=52824 RepID=A0A8X7U8B6_BRACI|nr:hypothetical protein Bca52824_064092 [Brassica carinata]